MSGLKMHCFVLLLLFSSLIIIAQNDEQQDNLYKGDETHEAVLDRIPENETAQFLIARQKVLDKTKDEAATLDAFEEMGISKEVFNKIPPSELLNLLNSKGYIEFLQHEHIGHDNGNQPPSPKQVLNILYTLIFIIAGLFLVGMYLSHLRKNKEQEIIIKALENNQEIPVTLLSSNKKKGYMNTAILLSAIGLSIIILGYFDILPPVLSVVPFSIAIGYFIIGYQNQTR